MKKLKQDEEIETIDQLQAAVKEMSEIDVTIETIGAECDAELAQVRQRHAERLIVKKGKQPVTKMDRRDDLARKVESYCWANRKTLLIGDAKFVDLTHGRVGWNKGRDTFDDTKAQVEGSTAFNAIASVAGSVLTYVSNLSVTIFGKRIAQFITIKVEWDKPAIKKAIIANADDATLIAEAGFEIVKGLDEFYCKPKRD